MSTRCQVRVSSGVKGNEEAVTLYHHHDGYPTYMLKMMAKAYKNARTLLENKGKEYQTKADYWELGRGGKMASFLCKEDPSEFEPESGHQLHGDIEWYYTIKPSDNDYSMAANPKWNVTVYKILGFDKEQKKIPIVTGDLEEAAKIAQKIEDEGNKKGEEYYNKRQKVRV